jgi:hypothetical protein
VPTRPTAKGDQTLRRGLRGRRHLFVGHHEHITYNDTDQVHPLRASRPGPALRLMLGLFDLLRISNPVMKIFECDSDTTHERNVRTTMRPHEAKSCDLIKRVCLTIWYCNLKSHPNKFLVILAHVLDHVSSHTGRVDLPSTSTYDDRTSLSTTLVSYSHESNSG